MEYGLDASQQCSHTLEVLLCTIVALYLCGQSAHTRLNTAARRLIRHACAVQPSISSSSRRPGTPRCSRRSLSSSCLIKMQDGVVGDEQTRQVGACAHLRASFYGWAGCRNRIGAGNARGDGHWGKFSCIPGLPNWNANLRDHIILGVSRLVSKVVGDRKMYFLTEEAGSEKWTFCRKTNITERALFCPKNVFWPKLACFNRNCPH